MLIRPCVAEIGNWQEGIAAVCFDIWRECWDEDEHRERVTVGRGLNGIRRGIKLMCVD